MNVGELYKQVAQLGFADSLEDSDRFYFAVNRALLQVCKVRPAINYCIINHNPLVNLIKESTFTPIEKIDDITFEVIDAKAYSFEADGNGTVYIENYDSDASNWRVIGMVELKSKQTFVGYKGLIKNEGSFTSGLVRLRFSGEFLYSIKNVAMYQHLYSNAITDIPKYEPFTRYNLRNIVSDFMAFNCPPILETAENTLLNQGYEQEGDSTILLPYDKRGVYKVLYERRPKSIENTGAASDDTQIIDLDDELCALMPILIASYVWIDDEPQKSEYYLSLYRERVSDITFNRKDTAPIIIKNTNGW